MVTKTKDKASSTPLKSRPKLPLGQTPTSLKVREKLLLFQRTPDSTGLRQMDVSTEEVPVRPSQMKLLPILRRFLLPPSTSEKELRRTEINIKHLWARLAKQKPMTS
jgi:hypothetical protein